MDGLAQAKKVVLAHYGLLDAAGEDGLAEALALHCDAACEFQFVHPFNEVTGPTQAAKVFWAPIKHSFAPLQRRQNIFMAGRNALNHNDSIWVVSMGHLLGLFDKPFLGIRPTRQGTMLRYAEFNCVSDGKIVASTLFLDIMNLMAQVRAEVMPPSTAATMVTPGPRTQDGLLFDNQPEDDGLKTLALYQRMINRLLSVDVHTTNTDLSLDWTDDMIWWGPGGIGAPYTQSRYLEQHCVPFEQGLEWGDFFGHTTEMAEGHYGGFFGWPTFDVRSRGGYIGLAPQSDKKVTMRVVDLYRREGDKLAENWNFIDHLHFLDQLGVDLIARQKCLTGL
ncbi:MAG: ester cyclase [Granulosicoccus sp.]|nr:ester cyclase [Granulosicoccus sp.]